MSDPLENLLAALRTIEGMRRLIVCEPHREAAVRVAVAELPWAGLYEVRASEICPPGQMLVLPTKAELDPPPLWGSDPLTYGLMPVNDPSAAINVTRV